MTPEVEAAVGEALAFALRLLVNKLGISEDSAKKLLADRLRGDRDEVRDHAQHLLDARKKEKSE